ncbi:endonuclease V [bacterium (Candidatus Blackallbacteria) CG17_big_fil_post_rev_8_21_14_2_50_48_46]|uniref:Endonuclease V n=1 Tax=bacterium (Candidatus Blackallbacteria) CG17_big_fil_post_rev_8_21_14_2_50_48_46 TaxID=2014261 RepID=A0A2M7FY84_9BACT|nr:MAG: endonuclease V [bacterium (Candidatus Blackallbacteria) CG18_big_fil_WC_8_21_14_2_50_49_26]PIW14298.1 MAG: endonuclease V [bacterium (Candidatus Blackallbacteria) CG17_big_fil_post_rev_8_21_14_2_50_48_46]PIW45567.1 MAG: endonuclease V [bacterium (Candidatus Blackallbacteria) CG13_big_fil_rev_8_21_14_2_50_49_14]
MPELKFHLNPDWNLSLEEALAFQSDGAEKVCLSDAFSEIQTVAGVDIAYAKDSELLIAGGVVLHAQTLEVLEKAYYVGNSVFPYQPGLFSFREVPPLLKALEQLSCLPDLIVCDGHGRAHPRRFGLASHLGLLLDIPTIGCGKTPLLKPEYEPGPERGARSPVQLNGETVGVALRTQPAIRPVYVSVGHRISLETACDWILRLSERYRQPETTRQANSYVNQLRQAGLKI